MKNDSSIFIIKVHTYKINHQTFDSLYIYLSTYIYLTQIVALLTAAAFFSNKHIECVEMCFTFIVVVIIVVCALNSST